MDTSLGIVLLCAFDISFAYVQDAYVSQDGVTTDKDNQRVLGLLYSTHSLIVDGRHNVRLNYQNVLSILPPRDCECTPNRTFLPDYDGYVARYGDARRPHANKTKFECTAINMDLFDLNVVREDFFGGRYNYKYKDPDAYRFNCHRKFYMFCINMKSFLWTQYMSLKGCTLNNPYRLSGDSKFPLDLEVLEIIHEVGLSDNLDIPRYNSSEYLSLKLFRWCPGKLSPLKTGVEILPSMPFLRTFTAEGCRLKRFPFGDGFLRTLRRCLRLELINLSHNDIQILEEFDTSRLKSPYLTLDFSHNKIHHVTSRQLYRLSRRQSIYVDFSHNHITYIDDDTMHSSDYTYTMPNVTIDFTNNQIKTIGQDSFQKLVHRKNIFVNLRNNTLDCDCGMSYLWDEYISHVDKYVRLKSYGYLVNEKCSSPDNLTGRHLDLLTLSDVCPKESMEVSDHENRILQTSVISATTLVAIILIICVLAFKYRTQIRVIMYMKFRLVLPWESGDFDENKRYDAFISYCNEDLTWVVETFLPMLTQNGNDFKICHHQKDFIPGKSIIENIENAIEWSRYTILVLSRDFIRSEWCIFEFRSAFNQSLHERKQQLIFILLDEIADDQMDSDLRKCLRFYTYIKADDVRLRERMTYALSDKRSGRKDRARRGARCRTLAVQPGVEGQVAAADAIQEAETVH